MIKKITKGMLFDYTAIAAMLTLMIWTGAANFGEFPVVETVKVGNLVTTAMFSVFWVVYIYIAMMFGRRRILLFTRVFSAFSLVFQVWFALAAASKAFIPDALAGLFSVLTIALNNHYIGLYYFLPVTAENLYAVLSFLLALLNFTLSWCFWLSEVGYFKKLCEKTRRKTRKERLNEEIMEIRRKRKEEKHDRS